MTEKKKKLKPIGQCPDGHFYNSSRTGKNLIGTTSVMDIQIIGDTKIEKRNHAVIMYDYKQKKTMLLPTDSHGMIYHKGHALFEPVTLEAFDEIELGESAFRFVPFRGDDFSWAETEAEG